MRRIRPCFATSVLQLSNVILPRIGPLGPASKNVHPSASRKREARASLVLGRLRCNSLARAFVGSKCVSEATDFSRVFPRCLRLAIAGALPLGDGGCSDSRTGPVPELRCPESAQRPTRRRAIGARSTGGCPGEPLYFRHGYRRDAFAAKSHGFSDGGCWPGRRR